MKKFLAVMAGVAMFVAPTNAALRLFFAPTGAPDANTAITAAPVRGNPTSNVNAGQSQRLFIWAEMISDTPGVTQSQKWNGIGLNIVANGGTITGREFFNLSRQDPAGEPGDPPIFTRWQGVNPGTLGATGVTGINLAAVVSGDGVTNSASARTWDDHSEVKLLNSTSLAAGGKATLLGYLDVQLAAGSNMATLFFQVGQAGITRSGAATAQAVYFGTGDETAGLTGASFGQGSPNFDAKLNLVPEPASMILLGLAALAIRRR